MLQKLIVNCFLTPAQHTGNFLHDSASLLNEGGDVLARVGVTVDHGGEVSHHHHHHDHLPHPVQVLHSASRAVHHGGELLHRDQSFLQVLFRHDVSLCHDVSLYVMIYHYVMMFHYVMMSHFMS